MELDPFNTNDFWREGKEPPIDDGLASDDDGLEKDDDDDGFDGAMTKDDSDSFGGIGSSSPCSCTAAEEGFEVVVVGLLVLSSNSPNLVVVFCVFVAFIKLDLIFAMDCINSFMVGSWLKMVVVVVAFLASRSSCMKNIMISPCFSFMEFERNFIPF
jgi:hypothetical protein